MANPRPDDKQPELRQQKSGAETRSDADNIRSISDVSSRVADSAADMSKRAARSSAEMLDRNKEVTQQMWDRSADLFGHMAQRYSDHMGRVLGFSGDNAEEVARKSSKNFEALVQSSDAIRSASRDLQQEWFDTARKLIDVTLGHSESVVGCRTPGELFAVQLDAVRNGTEAMLHGAKRLSEISARAATEATEKIGDAARRAG